MATVSDEAIGVVDEAVPAAPVEDLSGAQGTVDGIPPGNEVDNHPKGNDVAGGVGLGLGFQSSVPAAENWELELSTFNTTDRSTVVTEPCVICVVIDETDTNWRRSRYNYSLPLSSSVTDLYSAIAKEAGYVEGAFDLFWRKQETSSTEEELVSLDWKSTATLHEMSMPSEPTKAYLLIKEKDGVTPQRVTCQVQHLRQ